ncbi:unnamed protein product [Zymoseptoria tritici ST99CH_1A5]|uniref:Uncharacterized protein n=1 Tax=Zymoseptoria tritici ST99CH_1A5 TaxID=1276529 RepID=A0A1Y6LCG5_ZYMTR|nr:unnamed protein product [Zymoseptoria tritici ST99CH_1A5]
MATKRGNIGTLKRAPWHDFSAKLDEQYWPMIEMIAKQGGDATDDLIGRMKECEKQMRGCIGVYVGEIARAEGSLILNEYCGAQPDQTAPFLAEVSFFPSTDQRAVLTELVRDCYGHNFVKEGISIVDAPGLSRIAREVWYAIFVTEADFALSDSTLFSRVRQMKDNGPNRVAVVVTKRDSIDDRADQYSNAPGCTTKHSEHICEKMRRDLKVPVFVVSDDDHAVRAPTEPFEEDISITNLRDQILSFRIEGRLYAKRKWLEVEIPSLIELGIATDADRAVAEAEGREVHQISSQRLPELKGSLEALRRSLDARTMQFQEFVASFG